MTYVYRTTQKRDFKQFMNPVKESIFFVIRYSRHNSHCLLKNSIVSTQTHKSVTFRSMRYLLRKCLLHFLHVCFFFYRRCSWLDNKVSRCCTGLGDPYSMRRVVADSWPTNRYAISIDWVTVNGERVGCCMTRNS